MNSKKRDESEQSVDLYARARAGDDSAWEHLYERYGQALRFRIRARLGPELRAQVESMDLLQTVWLEAFTGLDRFEYRGEDSFLAWMTTVLRNKIASRIERGRTVKRGGASRVELGSEVERLDGARPRADAGPPTCSELGEESDMLRAAVDGLPPQHAELVRWAVLEELPFGEIARRLAVSEGAARMRVARATAKLTREFQRLSERG